MGKGLYLWCVLLVLAVQADMGRGLTDRQPAENYHHTNQATARLQVRGPTFADPARSPPATLSYIGYLRRENTRMREELGRCRARCMRPRVGTDKVKGWKEGTRRANDTATTTGAFFSLEERVTNTEAVVIASSEVVEAARVLLQELTRTGWHPDPTVRNPNPCEWKILGCSEDGLSLESLTVTGSSFGELRPDIFDMEGLANLTRLELSLTLKALPESIGRLGSLTALDLKGNKLASLPESIGGLGSLTALDLSGNKLASLPESIGGLGSLSTLDLLGNKLSSLPESIGELQNLTVLNLYRNKLITLPESIGGLGRLSELNLFRNKLITLPESIGGLGSLSVLNLLRNELRSLPESIGRLGSLSRLVLSGNKLASLPKSIGGLSSLTKLDLSRNKLASLPESIGELGSLRVLDLKGNKLASLPESIGGLGSLSTLNLIGNPLSSLPESIGRLGSLTVLRLNGNKLASLPESIGELGSLRLLYLNGNKLESLPESIGGLGSLSTLNLIGNPLSSLPESIGRLGSLATLNLIGNTLSSLPESIGGLGSLTVLYLHGNKLARLPESIGGLESLNVLDLSGNKLASLPESIGGLGSLSRLDLPANKLARLPESIGGLGSLRVLDMSGNKLASLPESMGELGSLSMLDLRRNKLASLPESIGGLGSLTVLNLSGNKLARLPESIGGLGKLAKLNLRANKLASLPESLGSLTRLVNLHLEKNQLFSLPPDIFTGMTSLVVLEMHDNKLASLPLSIGSMSSLTTFHISNNMLSSVPSSVGRLHRLKTFDANANRLTSIPASMGELQKLVSLDFGNNLLEELPAELFHSSQLKQLSLQNNRLVTFPRLRHPVLLKDVNLSNNRIVSLPDDIFNHLPRLYNFDISHNHLVRIPVSFKNLGHLGIGEFFANRISALPSGFFDWIAGLPSVSIALEDNLISAGMGLDDALPRLDGKSEVYVDRRIIPDTLGAEGFASTLLGVIDPQFVSSATPTRNGLGEECSLVTARHKDAQARVHIRSCRCANGFFRPSKVDTACIPCPRHGLCEDSKLHCYEDFYLRWLPGHAGAECTPCPEHATCFDNEMFPTSGAWWDTQYALGYDVWTSSVNGTSSSVGVPAYQTDRGMGETVFECRNPEACLGGTNATCAVGYAGHLCSTCSDGYFSSGHGVCERCPDPGSSLGLAVLGGMTGLLVLTGLLFRGGGDHDNVWQGAGKHAESTGAGALLSGVGGALGGNVAADDALTVVRVLVAFLQILVSLDVVFDVEWPDIMRVWDDLFGWVALDWLKSSSFECLWEYASRKWAGGGNEVANGLGYYAFSYYVSLVLTSGVPFLASVALMALYAVMGAAGAVFKEKHTLARFATIRERCLRMMLVLWMLAYLPVSSKAMGFFLCDSFNGGRTHWLHDDLSIRCYTPRYYAHAPVAAATLVIYTAGFPLLVVAGYFYHRWEQWQRRWRGQVGQTTLAGSLKLGAAWSTVSRAYRPQYGYWEAVEMARKLLVGAAAMHFGSTPTFQLTVALMVAFAAAVLHFYYRPYRAARAQRYAGANLILIYFTMSLGLLSRLDVDSGKRAVFAGTVLVLDAVFVAVLLALILWNVGEAVRTRGWALVVHAFARVRMLSRSE